MLFLFFVPSEAGLIMKRESIKCMKKDGTSRP